MDKSIRLHDLPGFGGEEIPCLSHICILVVLYNIFEIFMQARLSFGANASMRNHKSLNDNKRPKHELPLPLQTGLPRYCCRNEDCWTRVNYCECSRLGLMSTFFRGVEIPAETSRERVLELTIGRVPLATLQWTRSVPALLTPTATTIFSECPEMQLKKRLKKHTERFRCILRAFF